MTSYEPSNLEVFIHTLVSPLLERFYYKPFVQKLALKGNEKVIDYGSGAGSCAICLCRALTNGGHLTCIDISNRWLSIANKRLKNFSNAFFLHGHLANINLKPESCDLVIIHFVIHDIPKVERENALNYLWQALRPGGKLVIREPLNEKHGIRTEELHNLLESCGFRRIKLTTEKIQFKGNIVEGFYEKH